MASSNPRYLVAWPKEQPLSVGTLTSITGGAGLVGGTITTTGVLSVDFASAADVVAGTSATRSITPAALASASVLGISAGAGDAGKYLRLDAAGKIDASLFNLGNALDVQAGTANKVLDAAALAAASVKVFGSAADDGKYVRVTTTGKIDPSLLPASAMEFKGSVAATAAAPASPDIGDVYVVNAAGTFPASWPGISGQTGGVGDELIFDGTNWNLIPATSSGGTVTSIATGAGLAGGPITTTGTISLATSGVAAGVSGSGTQVPVVTVDAYGRVTAISTQTVTPAWANVTGTPTTVAGYGITDAVATSRTLTGTDSITGGGDLTANRTFSLVGDSAAPGNSYYYGTDATGTKGFYAFPAAGGTGTVTSIIAGAGLTGGTINTSGTIALAASGVAAGTYKSVTVDALGRVTAGTNPTTLAGYGITDAVPSTASISGGTSLAGGGALSGAPLTITLVNDAAAPGNGYYYGTDAAGVKGYHVLPAGGGGGGSVTYGTVAELQAGIDTTKLYNAATLAAAGYVRGPASATDNGVARFDAATGKLIQGSGVIIDDANNMSGVVNLTTSGSTILGDAAADTYTLNGSTMSVPNNLNIDSNTLMIDAANNRVGFGVAAPASKVDVSGTSAHNVSATTGAMDLNVAQMFTATVGATSWSFANVPAGRGVTVVLHLTNGGSGAQTWPGTIKWPGGTAPTLTAAGTDVLVFVTHDGGLTWRGNVFGKDVK